MKTRFRILCTVAVAVVLLGAPLAPVRAQEEEEKKTGWSDSAEFAFVSTSGNSESNTLGFKNVLTHDWQKASFSFRLGGTRVETTDTVFFVNTDDPDNPQEFKSDRLTTEIFYADARYNRDITKRFFWYVGAGWDRNVPAGIQNRYIGEGGVGNLWFDKERMYWMTTYGLSYTDQEDVIENPDIEGTFAGARLVSLFKYKFGGNAEYQNTTVYDYNFDNSTDWRVDMINSLAFAMSDTLGFKLSHQILFDNDPSLVPVDVLVFDPGTTPGSGTSIGTTQLPIFADDTDMILTVSLVVNF